jgi:uncharacterized membrane protein (DUF485 family)
MNEIYIQQTTLFTNSSANQLNRLILLQSIKHHSLLQNSSHIHQKELNNNTLERKQLTSILSTINKSKTIQHKINYPAAIPSNFHIHIFNYIRIFSFTPQFLQTPTFSTVLLNFPFPRILAFTFQYIYIYCRICTSIFGWLLCLISLLFFHSNLTV